MQFTGFQKPATGVVVPVSALRSRDSTGIGEFSDLILLGRWAAAAGLRLIQILPVNDTGFERSPYSALSAFALHPVYARLQDFPEAAGGPESIAGAIMELKAKHENDGPVAFDEVLSGKLTILRAMWRTVTREDRKRCDEWAHSNHWVRNYALFSLQKTRNDLRSWLEWPDHRDPDERELERLWKAVKKDAEFWVWMQWRLEDQLRSAAAALDSMGIALKGDIPILINDDSADVWADRADFRLTFRAGAPPDALSPDGQNWGFPTYDWNHLRADDFRWWRSRLDQAAKFYHAYRIDHVLGFFRIWAVPEDELSALGGHFEPLSAIGEEDLRSLGFDRGRITWLSTAHLPGDELRFTFGEEADAVASMLEQVGSEDLWRARPDGPSEQSVMVSALSPGAKDSLIRILRNRTLIPVGEGRWAPAFRCRESRGWNGLSNPEREGLEALIRRADEQSLVLWESTGRELLTMMKRDGGMLICAEDLGSIPDCVPGVLEKLEILGLRVVRWTRRWKESNQPYIPFDAYPRLSVATGSVHDSTTLRGWLAGEASNDGELRRVLNLNSDENLSGCDGVRTLLLALRNSSSVLVVHPIQDLLALDPSQVSADPGDERINLPGTVGGRNWTWRMNTGLEDLIANTKLLAEIRIICNRGEEL